MLILFEHLSVIAQTLWSLASSLGGARQICGLFIEGWRRLSEPLPSSSPGASNVLHLTCVILLRDCYLPKGPLLRAGFQVATLQTLLGNILNAELSRMLWISDLPVKLISPHWISYAVKLALMTCCHWRPVFYPLLFQPWGVGGGILQLLFCFCFCKVCRKCNRAPDDGCEGRDLHLPAFSLTGSV